MCIGEGERGEQGEGEEEKQGEEEEGEEETRERGDPVHAARDSLLCLASLDHWHFLGREFGP